MIMRRRLLLALLLFCAMPAFAGEWKEFSSEHFLVYYVGESQFAADVSNQAEKYYDKIAYDLGYSRYDNFWTWDNRVKIYIYPNREAYLNATNAKRWSTGLADYENKRIMSYADSSQFTTELLPHELAHLIFRDFVGFKGQVPVWLDEGVAQWEEEEKRKVAVAMLKEYIARGAIIPLAQLTQLNIAEETNTDLSRRFYVEAVTLVGFMIQKYGQSRFTTFCRGLRDGARINEALSSVYSDSVRDIDELEKEWLKYYGG